MQKGPETASFLVPVKKILEVANPFITPPWHCRPFTEDEVLEAVDKELFQHLPVPNWYPLRDQVARIAYLVVEGWDTRYDLPHLDVGVPGFGDLPRWIIEDGNHRVCAAAVRGDSTIEVIISGSLTYAEELLGIEVDTRKPGK